VASGLLGAAALGHAGWGLLRSDTAFSVRRIQVIGLTRHDDAPIQDALRDLRGRNLFTLKPQEVADRVISLPWLQGFLCRKHLPDTLIVEVQERPQLCAVATPAGVIELGGQGLTWPALPGAIGLFEMRSGVHPDSQEVQGMVKDLLGLGLAGRITTIAPAPDKGAYTLGTPEGWSLIVTPGSLQRQWDNFQAARTWVQMYMPDRRTLDLRWNGKVVLGPPAAPEGQDAEAGEAPAPGIGG
jgi:cell division septal protein FtsQ